MSENKEKIKEMMKEALSDKERFELIAEEWEKYANHIFNDTGFYRELVKDKDNRSNLKINSITKRHLNRIKSLPMYRYMTWDEFLYNTVIKNISPDTVFAEGLETLSRAIKLNRKIRPPARAYLHRRLMDLLNTYILLIGYPDVIDILPDDGVLYEVNTKLVDNKLIENIVKHVVTRRTKLLEDAGVKALVG